MHIDEQRGVILKSNKLTHFNLSSEFTSDLSEVSSIKLAQIHKSLSKATAIYYDDLVLIVQYVHYT